MDACLAVGDDVQQNSPSSVYRRLNEARHNFVEFLGSQHLPRLITEMDGFDKHAPNNIPAHCGARHAGIPVGGAVVEVLAFRGELASGSDLSWADDDVGEIVLSVAQREQGRQVLGVCTGRGQRDFDTGYAVEVELLPDAREDLGIRGLKLFVERVPTHRHLQAEV